MKHCEPPNHTRRRGGDLLLMWSGSDVALPGHGAGGGDGGEDSIVENIIVGPLVDIMTTAVAEMDVEDGGEQN